jgi:cell surface protein SprA
LKLKAICSGDDDPRDPVTHYMWWNIYRLDYDIISADSFDVDIFKGGPGTEWLETNLNHQDGVPYIEILGLDKFDAGGNMKPDGKCDTVVIDYEHNLLIFPDRHPFNPSEVWWPGNELLVKFPEMYYNIIPNQYVIESSVYYITVSYYFHH